MRVIVKGGIIESTLRDAQTHQLYFAGQGDHQRCSNAEDLAAECILVDADPSVHPDLLSSQSPTGNWDRALTASTVEEDVTIPENYNNIPALAVIYADTVW